LNGKLFVISASSGAGKTSLVLKLIERVGKKYDLMRVVTYTTKQPRSTEVPGVDYHFVQESEFLKKIEQDFFIEHSTAYGAYYGFPRKVIDQLKKGTHYIAIVDTSGARALKKHVDSIVLIWIEAQEAALKKRLALRGRESTEEIDFRVQISRDERERKDEELFHYKIMNENFESALKELESLVIKEIESHTKEGER
jgi:guanylate kinase